MMKRACLLPTAAAVLAAGGAYRSRVRPWQRRWGATDDEVRSRLPGDELVAEPATQATRAIGIDAPPDAVWPWVVQIGADRAGFYSYERLENVFALGIHNAELIVPEWQQRAVGDRVLGDAKGRGWWYVMAVEPGRALVLQTANPATGRPARRDEGFGMEFLWTFALQAVDDHRSRLVVRERVALGNPRARLLMAPVGFVSFVMTRRMLRGIKARAERGGAPGRP